MDFAATEADIAAKEAELAQLKADYDAALLKDQNKDNYPSDDSEEEVEPEYDPFSETEMEASL